MTDLPILLEPVTDFQKCPKKFFKMISYQEGPLKFNLTI